MSRFCKIEMGRTVQTSHKGDLYGKDPHPQKCDLVVSAYRDDRGQPWTLDVVRIAEQQIAEDECLNHEYLPITGLPSFVKASCQLLLGKHSPAVVQNRYGGCQGVGSIGSIYVGLDFLKRHANCNMVYVSNPTIDNHIGISQSLGFEVREYPYWDEKSKDINITDLLDCLRNAPQNSIIILHASAHNPTGMDPTREQWQQIATVIKDGNLFPFFDLAYQGLATGDYESDAWAPRFFVNEGMECFVAQTFSNNFGLYDERVGNLCYVVNDSSVLPRMTSQIKLIVRRTYSNPPSHGARAVATILNNQAYLSQWKEHLKVMVSRIKSMRIGLYNRLKELGTPGNWSHITAQTGMYAFTGLHLSQVEELQKKHYIYLMDNGRINISSLNTSNLDYVANAIHDVVSGE